MKTADSFPVFDLEFLINLENEEELYHHLSDQYNEVADGYYATANYKLLENLHIQPNARVLDLACGTGHLAIEIAKRAPRGKVVGVDLATNMLVRAREDAKKAGVQNTEFIERDIREILPDFKLGDFDIGICCFALSFLEADFLFKEFYSLLGNQGQIGITTSSVNSLIEWQPLFLELMMEHAQENISFSSMPMDAQDLRRKLENAGFSNVQVESQRIPLKFRSSEEAVQFVISTGFLSNYFFSIKDKAERRRIIDFATKKLDEYHKEDAHLLAHVEFLIGWNNLSASL